MNKLTMNKKRKLTRKRRTIISAFLFIMAFSVCIPVFASAQSADLQLITPVSGSPIEIYRVSADKSYLDGLTVSAPTLEAVKAQLENPASQIIALKGETQIGDSERIGTGYTIKCVSSDNSATVYEQSAVVLHGDVNGDTAVDAFDVFRIDLAVNDYVTLYDEYLLAADLDCSGEVTLADYNAVKNELLTQDSINQSAFYNTFKTVFTNTDRYLYRIGNGNTVALGKLFERDIEGVNAVNSSNVKIKVEAIDASSSVYGSGTNLAAGSTAKCVYTKNSSDWTASTLKFTGEGPVKVTVFEAEGFGCELNLEVVNAINATTATSATNANIVLLNNVSGGVSISNNKTLYGNGFTVTDTRSHPTNTEGYVTMNGGGCANNVKFVGYEPTNVASSNGDSDYSPAVKITGDASLYNCYVSGGRYAIMISGNPTVVIKNTTVDGGAFGNVQIAGGNVTLENVTTTISTRGGKKGLGLHFTASDNTKLTLNGYFRQYNWVLKSDLPSQASSSLSDLYNNTTYAYAYGGKTYVNGGIFFFTTTGNITQAQAQEVITDNTSNNYGYIQKTSAGYTGTLYTQKASTASPSSLNAPDYVEDQYCTLPLYSFDYTTKNYIPRQTGDNNYCYYDSTTGTVNISFDKLDSSSSFSWDTDILTVNKYGQSIAPTVTMGGVDYTGNSITFTESGDYEVVYSYTDPMNYDKDLTASDVTYTKTVKIKVTAVEPEDNTHYASFAYDGAAGNYSAKIVIGTDNKTYVMPDVTSTSSTIGSTTIGGKTVYYPIVTVNPTSSNGNSAYSSGDGYYFAPVFSEIHIIDYNQDTGVKQYEYSKSTTTWPHGKSATSGPDTAYFTCASGEKVFSSTSPYARNMNSQYYKYNKNNLGVCYTSCEISKDNSASTHLVQYHYVSTDGTTYYYYVQYNFGAMTHTGGGCFEAGSLVTMADGTKKPIEDINVGDMVLTWSMWKGCYEAQPVVISDSHGVRNWDTVRLSFSDGSDISVVYKHGFFDVDRNGYVYITPENAEQFVGDRFIKLDENGVNSQVVLTAYQAETRNVPAYTVATAYNMNCIVNDMLTITPDEIPGLWDYFEIGEGMKYDEEKMQADISQYGLYSYDDFADYLTLEQFELLNFAYFKPSVEKGKYSFEDIVYMINTYLNYNQD